MPAGAHDGALGLVCAAAILRQVMSGTSGAPESGGIIGVWTRLGQVAKFLTAVTLGRHRNILLHRADSTSE